MTLREYITAIMDRDERFIDHRFTAERRLRMEVIGTLAAFGVFAWSQIQRRLEILNHENARVAGIASSTVSADTYGANEKRRDDERDKLDTWRGDVDKKLGAAATREEVERDTRYEHRAGIDTTTKMLGVAFTVIALALSFLVYQNATKPTKPTPITVVVTTQTP